MQILNYYDDYIAARSRRRKEDAQASLFKVPPNEDERFDIHELFLSTVDAR